MSIIELQQNDEINSHDDDETLLNESESETYHLKPNIRKDLHNVIFLIFLYILQGVPLGLTGSLPFILGSRNVSYADQGTFSLAFWPFGLKLLWAPFVDSLYIKKIGRRKSWLVPMQYTIGIFLIIFSNYVNQLLEINETTSRSDIYYLTIIFFIITFFAATQDIAVDGWGLTILSKENVSWSSTCNSVGQTAGWFIGNVIFLIVQSRDFSNDYIRKFFGLAPQPYGIVTVKEFMNFFGIVFILTTTFVLIFKKEKETHPESLEDSLTLTQTYKLVWQIIKLPGVKRLSILLLTCKIAFGVQSMTYLKLIEQGVTKESLGLLAIPLTPFEIILPLLVSKYTNGPKPLNIFINTYPFRILSCGLMVFWVFLTPSFQLSNNQYPLYYFLICILLNVINSTFSNTQSVTLMSFFTRVSDKTVGGTFMTLLNTISNIGSNWPSTLSLYLVDLISIKYCYYDEIAFSMQNKTLNETISFKDVLKDIDSNKCYSESQKNQCLKYGAKCLYKLDSYYLLAFIFSLVGIVWIITFKPMIKKLQSYPKSSWKLKFNF